MSHCIGRREFITVLAGAATPWPLAARAQQMPVIGYLSSGSPQGFATRLAAFRQGITKSIPITESIPTTVCGG
jgi:putative tryptophan/tyrosine transport system substrate-binding protein